MTPPPWYTATLPSDIGQTNVYPPRLSWDQLVTQAAQLERSKRVRNDSRRPSPLLSRPLKQFLTGDFMYSEQRGTLLENLGFAYVHYHCVEQYDDTEAAQQLLFELHSACQSVAELGTATAAFAGYYATGSGHLGIVHAMGALDHHYLASNNLKAENEFNRMSPTPGERLLEFAKRVYDHGTRRLRLGDVAVVKRIHSALLQSTDDELGSPGPCDQRQIEVALRVIFPPTNKPTTFAAIEQRIRGDVGLRRALLPNETYSSRAKTFRANLTHPQAPAASPLDLPASVEPSLTSQLAAQADQSSSLAAQVAALTLQLAAQTNQTDQSSAAGQ